MEKLILLRGATSVVEFDFSAFEFYDEGFCQFVMKRKINDDVICRLDFKERKKYYVTFKDEFTAGLDRDEYRFDIMLMLEDERYRQYYTSDIFVEDVVNKYVGVIDNNAIEIAEAVADDVEITQTIKVTTSNVIIASSNLQERTVTPTKEEQVVLAEDGFDGMSKVVVEAIPSDYVIPNLQEKEARITAPTNIFVHPDEEYDGLSFVNVIASVDTETKEVTPSKEVQNISRSEGKYIDNVTINPIPDEYIIPSGELDITENGSYNVTDKTDVNVNVPPDLSEYFATETFSVLPTNLNIWWVTAVKKMPPIKNTANLNYYYRYFQGEELDFSLLDFSKATSMASMFSYCQKIKKLDLSNFDTSKVTSMQSMFFYCTSLEEVILTSFDTSKVTNMREMFSYCPKIKKIDLSNFDTTELTETQEMFNANNGSGRIGELKEIIFGENFTISKVGNAYKMFSYTSVENLDLSKFNFEKCYMGDIFVQNPNLTNLTFGVNYGKRFTTKSANYSYYKLSLSASPLLTHDSLMSVINNLYDLNLTYDVANGGTLYTQSLVLGADNLAKLTEEELAVATSKGWSIS